jgi:hypothetical protein
MFTFVVRSEQLVKPVHIRPQKLWAYLNFKDELLAEEHEHLGSCKRCLEVFRLCVLADSPEKLENDDEMSQSA